jgi:DNA/RNA-binding domain of Phe-tRNA-synthetase-like protein
VSFTPVVESQIMDIRPDYCALSVVAEGVRNSPRHAITDALLTEVCDSLPHPEWAEDHLESWRCAYRAFAAKPQRTPCSVEALLKRVEREGRIPSVNAVVDLYNALSIRFVLPIGGENKEAYAGIPRLTRATGHQRFDTTKDGAPHEELVPAGEIIWCDNEGVTCRRWNWRQCLRTRIEETTTSMWFVLERLDPMPVAALLEAGTLLGKTLQELSPGAAVTTVFIARSA